MLEYEPLWLHKFHQDTKEAGIKCNLAQVSHICLSCHDESALVKVDTFQLLFSCLSSGATISRSPLHMFPHRDKKAKQTKVAEEEKEVPSEEENSKEKVAEKEKALRCRPFGDPS